MCEWHEFPETPHWTDDLKPFIVHIEYLYKQYSGGWDPQSYTFIGVYDDEEHRFWDADGEEFGVEAEKYNKDYKDVRGWWAFASPADTMTDHEKAFLAAKDWREREYP